MPSTSILPLAASGVRRNVPSCATVQARVHAQPHRSRARSRRARSTARARRRDMSRTSVTNAGSTDSSRKWTAGFSSVKRSSGEPRARAESRAVRRAPWRFAPSARCRAFARLARGAVGDRCSRFSVPSRSAAHVHVQARDRDLLDVEALRVEIAVADLDVDRSSASRGAGPALCFSFDVQLVEAERRPSPSAWAPRRAARENPTSSASDSRADSTANGSRSGTNGR